MTPRDDGPEPPHPSTPRPSAPRSPSLSFLTGGGEAGALLRAHAWDKTSLGAPETWPQSLKTLVGVMLGADQPMFVAWGPEHLLLYNQRYAPLLADRHPVALGRPFLDVWSEVREELAPLVDQVFAGEPVHMADIALNLYRKGRPVEAHFAFSYTPVHDEQGVVVALFCACSETTEQIQAERSRQAAAERQRRIFQHMPGFVGVLTGPEHRFEYVNDAYVEIVGPRGFVGRPIREVFPELDAQGYFTSLDRVYATGDSFRARTVPLRLQRDDGPRFVDILYQPIRDDDGTVSGVFVGGYDVTELVHAQSGVQAERDRLASVLDSMTDAFALLDRDFVIRDVNAAAIRIENRPREAIVGRTHWDAYPGSENSPLGQLYKNAMADGVTVELEHRHVLESGREAWLHMRAYPVPEGLAIFYRDVSARRRSETELRTAEEMNRRILASSADCIKVLDLDGQLEFMSEGGMCVMEVDDFAAIKGACWPDLWQGKERALALAAVEQARRGQTGRFLGFGTTMKGAPRWWDVIVTPINDPDGRPDKLLSVSRDVTAAKQAEAALRESEEKARLITETATDYAIITMDADRRITSWSRGAEAIFLWTEPEIVGQLFDVLFTPEDRAAGTPEREVGEASRTGLAPDERWHLRKDRSRFFARGSVRALHHADGTLRGFLKVARDGTEQRRTEAALQRSEEALRLATDAAEVGTWDLDLIVDELAWSDRTKAMFGIAPDAPCSMVDFYAGLHPDDREHTTALFVSAIDPAQRTTYDAEYRTIGKEDGIVRWVAAKGRGIFDDQGVCIRAIGTAIDITRRKAAEKRRTFLLDLFDRLRTLSEPRPLMQVAVDALGTELRVSRVGYGLVDAGGDMVVLETEYVDGASSLAGTYPIEAFGPGNIATLRAGRTSIYTDVEADPGTAGIGLGAFGIAALVAVPVLREGRLRSVLYVNDGVTRDWTPDQVGLIEDVAGRVWEAVERARAQDELRALNATLEEQVADRTRELMAIEEQLRQAQKMEAVGQLTGGIAHDFNNLLTGVIGSLDLMQRRIARGETDQVERYATAAMTSANRAAALTHRLLAFSRRQPLDPKPVNANRLATGMEDLLRRTIGEAVQLEIVTAGGLWQTLCDPHQLESAILNLAINARDAMPGGGKLTIETCNAHLDGAYAAKSREVRPGQYICICVTDTGTGMSQDVVSKAFEPFFTTKPIGQGTGLGLSMIYGFARQSEGYAKIYSEVGHGTTMKLYLPRFYGESEEAEEARAELGDEHRSDRGEVVLIVEDEHTVRALVVEVLQELGYRAIEAVDGPSGLKMVQSRGRLDLLVTDIGLPGLNGRQLADAARELRPGLKVLFMTGYAENATIANGFLEPGMQMITKPFAIEALATRIRDMIETNIG